MSENHDLNKWETNKHIKYGRELGEHSLKNLKPKK